MKVDLEWDDDHVVPPKFTPDLVFLFDRMIEAAVDKVDPARGDLVLDVGCGRAVDAIKIVKKGARGVGLEPSRTMLKHCRDSIAETGVHVGLVQAVGETLPFKSETFDWVVCKGALDHFPDPYKTMEEIARVLKPDGRAVISLANFESLGHRLGRNAHRLTRFLPRREPGKRQAWETPEDHTFRFDYALMHKVVSSHLDIEESVGICLLWGAPLWDRFTSFMPRRISYFIMGTLDRMASHLPGISDVVMITACRKAR